jgi:pimeloyl-ACP methyl ester carboxylesterase
MHFSDHYTHTGEIKLHYSEGPKNGPPLVLIHGATGSINDWTTVQAALAQDWHLFLLDQRGHGQSGHAATMAGYHAANNIADTLAFLRDVVGERAVVWGHSWGAIVTLLSAGTAQAYLRGIVLEDPPVMIRREICPEMKPYMDFFGMLFQLKQTATTREAIAAALHQGNPQVPAEALAGMVSNVFNVDLNFLRIVLAGPEIVAGIDFAQAIRAASMPTLLMQADPALGAALAAEDLAFVQANNPAFHLVHFPGASHGIHSDQPEKTLKVFQEFIRGLGL